MKKILVAPLNWGLGHATRCMPIINQLLTKDCEVIIASDGRSLQLLQQEYPQLKTIELPAYQINYGSSGEEFVQTMVIQIPKILRQIRKEYLHLQRIVDFYDIDIVISDNRYGCWSKKAYTIFITHQLFIKMPDHLQYLEPLVKWFNQRFINQFDACWIPDYDDAEINLTGELAHKYTLNKERYHFIGPLSRFTKNIDPINIDFPKADILIVLSGPEPQRSLFEEKILGQVKGIQEKICVIRGITETTQHKHLNPHLSIIDHLTAHALNAAMLHAKIIIARTGYSTIMDLVKLGKTAILVPTPGQTEQEYLARYFMDKKMFYCPAQKDFELKQAIALSRISHYNGNKKNNQLEIILNNLFKKEQSKNK